MNVITMYINGENVFMCYKEISGKYLNPRSSISSREIAPSLGLKLNDFISGAGTREQRLGGGCYFLGYCQKNRTILSS